MSFSKKEGKAAVADKQRSQRLILEKYGQKKIDEVEKRLCFKCTMPCLDLLYPITEDGKDCPYFIKMMRGRKR